MQRSDPSVNPIFVMWSYVFSQPIPLPFALPDTTVTPSTSLSPAGLSGVRLTMESDPSPLSTPPHAGARRARSDASLCARHDPEFEPWPHAWPHTWPWSSPPDASASSTRDSLLPAPAAPALSPSNFSAPSVPPNNSNRSPSLSSVHSRLSLPFSWDQFAYELKITGPVIDVFGYVRLINDRIRQ